ncbi:PAS domain S-box protein, partial [Streptomyces paradoxus]|uniref:PAS domain S-box protein n=2 Tax=Streptomyces TaxID=1883 RepID=UPI00362F4625
MNGTSEGPASAADLDRSAVTESDQGLAPRTARERPAAYRSVFTAAPLAMAVVDTEGLVVSANDTLGTLLGNDPDALVGCAAADLVDLASDAGIWHAYREVLRGRQPRLRCTRRLKRADGHSLWAQVTVEPLADAGDTPGLLLSVADVSARRELQARLRHLQMHDPVTRLPNRALFFERLTAALEAETYEHGGTGRIGVCYLDLDGFK